MGETYTKSFFLKIQDSSDLTDLSNQFATCLAINSYNFDPHMSVFYGTIPLEDKEKLKHGTSWPEELKFSTLIAMGTPQINRSYQDIESWVELERKSL